MDIADTDMWGTLLSKIPEDAGEIWTAGEELACEIVIGLNVGAEKPGTRVDDRLGACTIALDGETSDTRESCEIGAEGEISEGRIVERELTAVDCENPLGAKLLITLVPDTDAGLTDDRIGDAAEAIGENDATVGKI